MGISEQDIRLFAVDRLLGEAEAYWVDDMLAAASPPSADTTLSREARNTAEGLFDTYLTGPEARAIMRLIFQLKTAQIDDAQKMLDVIERNNASLHEDIADDGYERRTGVRKPRLQEALMTTPNQQEVMLTAVRHGAGVLHKNGYCKLLVRQFNKNKIGEALDVLADAGFFERRPGANNSDFYISDGRLEDIYKTYLARIEKGAAP